MSASTGGELAGELGVAQHLPQELHSRGVCGKERLRSPHEESEVLYLVCVLCVLASELMAFQSVWRE